MFCRLSIRNISAMWCIIYVFLLWMPLFLLLQLDQAAGCGMSTMSINGECTVGVEGSKGG